MRPKVAELMRAQGVANEGALRAVLSEFGAMTDAELRARRLGRTARRMAKRGEVVRVRQKGSDHATWALYDVNALSLSEAAR